ncbi:MAG: hypothetical protein SPI91_01190 [Bacilli bacterium]|nr:hypothetical protein [Candidatus Onthovivens sp.]MDY6015057.1 hypothetical protein [Bacilli bacterium]
MPIENSSSNISYSLTCTNDAKLSSTEGQYVSITIPNNSNRFGNITYTVTCTVTFKKSDGTIGQVYNTGTYIAKSRSGR